jgi:hypothetical protein
MQLSMTSLMFNAECGGGLRVPSQSITVTNAGGGTLTWMVGTPSEVQNGVTIRSAWLTVSPEHGSDAAGESSQITFAVPVTAIPCNTTYTATLVISPDGGTPQTVMVTLTA